MEIDAVYANLFGADGQAAVLACDELGLVPQDLLYQPKKSFERSDNDESAVLVRYTLTERSRQNNIRKVLAIKNRLIVDGDVKKKWRERCKLFPGAPGVPKISKAYLAKVMAELDTQSEDDAIDELGLPKPPPLYGGLLSEAGGSPERSPPRSPSPQSAFTSASSWRGQRRKKGNEQQEMKKRDQANRSVDKDNAEDCARSHMSSKVSSGRPRCPRPPADPPFFPPVPYSRRDSVTVRKELEELDEYRRFLLRYVHDSFAMAKEYSAFVKSLRETGAAGSAKRGEGTSDSTKFLRQKRADSVNGFKGGEDNEKAVKTPFARTSMLEHKRQLATYVRLAKLKVKRNRSNFKKWNGFMEEMDGVEPMGTIAADIRARSNVGVCPTFEDYVQSVKEKTQRRERALAQEKLQRKRLNAISEAKERQREEHMEKLRGDRRNLIMEAHLVQNAIKRKNRERETRRQEMKGHRVQVQLNKKEMKAAERHMKRLLRAKEKKFQHDAEEIFRRSLKEKMHAMDMTKKWDVKLVHTP